ncbi:hypothetical protein DH86_00004255 [Scytalidium sp. 3C]|nr:hypothetical protein DH86_00004255 [Scytalidium sp. 3C]
MGGIITLTEGPSVYVVYYSTQVIAYGETATGTVSESCKLQGTTAADCSANVFLKAGGTSTKASTTSLLTGADYHRFNVAITGGADKTASATGSCKSSGATSQTNSRGVVTIAVLGALGLAAVLSL